MLKRSLRIASQALRLASVSEVQLTPVPDPKPPVSKPPVSVRPQKWLSEIYRNFFFYEGSNGNTILEKMQLFTTILGGICGNSQRQAFRAFVHTLINLGSSEIAAFSALNHQAQCQFEIWLTELSQPIARWLPMTPAEAKLH